MLSNSQRLTISEKKQDEEPSFPQFPKFMPTYQEKQNLNSNFMTVAMITFKLTPSKVYGKTGHSEPVIFNLLKVTDRLDNLLQVMYSLPRKIYTHTFFLPISGIEVYPWTSGNNSQFQRCNSKLDFLYFFPAC